MGKMAQAVTYHASTRIHVSVHRTLIKIWAQQHVPVVPKIGSQRPQDPWGLLASQPSSVSQLSPRPVRDPGQKVR